jgi:hypothetical protein
MVHSVGEMWAKFDKKWNADCTELTDHAADFASPPRKAEEEVSGNPLTST